nr:uncharacterized protein LOC101951016 [Chrysemys picta bellii]
MWEPTAEIQAAAAAPSRAIGCGGGRRGERRAALGRRGTGAERRAGREREGSEPGRAGWWRPAGQGHAQQRRAGRKEEEGAPQPGTYRRSGRRRHTSQAWGRGRCLPRAKPVTRISRLHYPRHSALGEPGAHAPAESESESAVESRPLPLAPQLPAGLPFAWRGRESAQPTGGKLEVFTHSNPQPAMGPRRRKQLSTASAHGSPVKGPRRRKQLTIVSFQPPTHFSKGTENGRSNILLEHPIHLYFTTEAWGKGSMKSDCHSQGVGWYLCVKKIKDCSVKNVRQK